MDKRTRHRASKACHRCNQRKIKCDAMHIGPPCTRCRMDQIDDCILIVSKRGIYDRTKARRRQRANDSTAEHRPSQRANPEQATLSTLAFESSEKSWSTLPLVEVHDKALSSHLENPQPSHSPSLISLETNLSPHEDDIGTDAGQESLPKEKSLAAMFESFLNQHVESSSEGRGIVLLGGPSPLTLALEELKNGKSAKLYDVDSHIDANPSTACINLAVHPSHLDKCDIQYLKAKGAFEYPETAEADTLLAAYLQKFDPIYSIVKKAQLESAFRERKLSWLLLHTVCFIGATFCDRTFIHQSRFSSRSEAKRFYYEKAKALFMLGYETDKITLIQAALMLSFCGPQLKDYWNPGSWVGFGVTIAVSLGIHRASSCTRPRSREDTSLLRRLFWTLVIRDAYVSALLGRSFRFNMALCDTEPLTCDDFELNEDCGRNRHSDCKCKEQILYQIHGVSLILRNIIIHRIGPGKSAETLEDLQAQLVDWKSNLPESMSWSRRGSSSSMAVTSLKILFNYLHILLYMAGLRRASDQELSGETHADAITEPAASAIASTAINIMTKSSVPGLPHELFPAFFLAGILFYRKTRHPDAAAAEKGQASLDNCQIVLNEARECWDPSNWAMKLFDFLLSSCNDTGDLSDRDLNQKNLYSAWEGLSTSMDPVIMGSMGHLPLGDSSYEQEVSNAPIDAPFDVSFLSDLGDYMSMPSYWLPTVEELQRYHIS